MSFRLCVASAVVLMTLSSAPVRRSFNRIAPANVVIEYRYSGLGYVLRPEGPIPTVVVKLTGLTYQLVALKGFLGLGPITMPDFKITITGEDINSAAPS